MPSYHTATVTAEAICCRVPHHDILFSEKDNKIYCVLNAPNLEAIEKHHAKAGIKCDWIQEVKSTRG